MNETFKAYKRMDTSNAGCYIGDGLWDFVSKNCSKPWLDIGPGSWCMVGCDPYDREQGDANDPHLFDGPSSIKQYGLVWSSHCLEHMEDAEVAIGRWWDFVMPGGVMWLMVPDFALYEHGCWPSVMNPDHKWSFSCYGKPLHVEHLILDDLWRTLDDVKLLRLGIQAQGYDFSRIFDPVDQTHGTAEASCELVLRKLKC